MTEPADVRSHIKKSLGQPTVLLALIAALIVATVVAGWYWGRYVRSSHRAAPPVIQEVKMAQVVLYFPAGDHLETETREVPETVETVSLGGNIVQALLAGPGEEGLDRVMSEGTELRAFFIDADGVAYIDVDRKALAIPCDALSAYLSMQSFFQSLKRNVPEVKAVKFLIDAREVDSLWGHFDATAPWSLTYEER